MNTLSHTLPNIYTRSIKNVFRREPMRVGIVLSGVILPYLRATAVARLRVYDVIEMFANDSRTAVELYLPGRRYDVVIFEKMFTPRALSLAHALRRRGTRVLLDVNVDYFSRTTPRVTDEVYRNAHQFAKAADCIIVPSERLQKELRDRNVHSRIEYIPEPLPDRYFTQQKTSFSKVPGLIWSGYHEKAAELMVIEEHIRGIQKKYGASLILISDRDPGLASIPYQFIPYRERSVAVDLAQGDVFIAPRRFDQPYKYHHTFTKIGAPMAVGLPVFASPLPSYLSSPAVQCHSDDEWHISFENLYAGRMDLAGLSQRGREYCQKEFSWERVRTYYDNLFRSVVTIQP